MNIGKYDICTQYLKKGDIAWWVNYFGIIEPVKVYEVQKMGPTPDYAIYYWIKPITLNSKLRSWVFIAIFHTTRFLNTLFRTNKLNKVRENRFVNRNFFWWPGHAVMVGDTIFLTKEELMLELSEEEQ